MATLSRDLWQVYHRAVCAQADNAGAYMRRLLATYLEAHKTATIADIRNYAIKALFSTSTYYGELTSATSSLLYDLTMEYLGISVPSAEIYDTMTQEQASKIAHYQATKLVNNDPIRFIDMMSKATSDSVRWQANKTVTYNANRETDKKKGIRFARVVSGSETCTFCMMLASQGFVYQSEKAALYKKDGVNRYHHGCKCGVIPGIQGTELEGYDFQEIYDRWNKFAEIDAQKDKTWEERQAEKEAYANENPIWVASPNTQKLVEALATN